MSAIAGMVSEDGLWSWSGKSWVHVDRVGARCGRCQDVVAVKSGKSSFKCADGHEQDFVACKQCKGTFQRPTENRIYDTRCPHCGWTDPYASMVSGWEWAADQQARTVHGDPDARVLRDFTLAAGGGTKLPTGSRCSITFTSDGMDVATPDGSREFVAYADIQVLQITGSRTTSSAGVFGGGFGVAGAVEGMLAASVINGLTSSTTVYSVVRVAARAAEYVFVSRSIDSGALGMMLTPVQLRIRQATPAAPTSGVADELAKLAQLRDSGVLSDAEFGSAKARLLGL